MHNIWPVYKNISLTWYTSYSILIITAKPYKLPYPKHILQIIRVSFYTYLIYYYTNNMNINTWKHAEDRQNENPWEHVKSIFEKIGENGWPHALFWSSISADLFCNMFDETTSDSTIIHKKKIWTLVQYSRMKKE